MKTIALLFLSFFMVKGCSNEKKQQLATTEIVYTTTSRGSFQKITIHKQEISINKDRNDEGLGVTSKITDANWSDLVKLFGKLDLEKLSTYEGPTQKRFYDGAAIANLIVTYKEKQYNSASFDHGNPPVEIEDFIKKVLFVAKIE
jgi:hypothetical protein